MHAFRPRLGFTLVEVIVVIAILAVVLSLALPSYTGYLARKRVEGTFNELQTDVHFARSEAVSRNLPVRLTFGAGCYLVHTSPPGAGASSCTATAPSTIGTSAIELKTVQVAPASTAQLSPDDALAWIEFDPLRGGATRDAGGTALTVSVNSSIGGWQLRVALTPQGRVQGCSPGGTVQGYAAC